MLNKNILLITILSLLIVGCFGESTDGNETSEQKSNLGNINPKIVEFGQQSHKTPNFSYRTDYDKLLPDSLAKNILSEKRKRIFINDTIVVNWNIEESLIIKDSIWLDFISTFNHNKELVLDLILDTSFVEVYSCYSDYQLRKGDFVFVILSTIYRFSYAEVFGFYFDLMYSNCSFPIGLFESISSDRDNIHKIFTHELTLEHYEY